jgi:hypothetical protein
VAAILPPLRPSGWETAPGQRRHVTVPPSCRAGQIAGGRGVPLASSSEPGISFQVGSASQREGPINAMDGFRPIVVFIRSLGVDSETC